MKNFLAQEHEKLSLWWATISAKEIALYLLLTFALLLPVYLYYAALGITGLTEWYRCLRSFAECGLLFFLTELVTRRSLLHPFWRIGYIPFFSWILIFPYVLTHAVNGMKDASFNHLSPYFLTAMAILLLLFFVMNVISRVYVGKRLATLICLALVCFFTFNAFIFLTHYEFMGIMMTSKEMFFALTNTSRWCERIVLSHISLLLLLFSSRSPSPSRRSTRNGSTGVPTVSLQSGSRRTGSPTPSFTVCCNFSFSSAVCGSSCAGRANASPSTTTKPPDNIKSISI